MVKTYNEEQIKDILPHRDPFLFVEKMEIIEDGIEGIGYKNITMDMDFFKGHFPGNPILPGACITDIVKCCAEKVVNRSLEIKSVRNLKFLQIIQPDNVANLKITLKISSANDELVCKAIVASDAIVFSKMDLYLISRS